MEAQLAKEAELATQAAAEAEEEVAVSGRVTDCDNPCAEVLYAIQSRENTDELDA